MKLKDIMTKGVECVHPGDTLQEAARKMKDLDVGPMPVCSDGDKIVGMLTDRDIAIRAVAEGKDPKTTKVQEAMSEEVIWCYEDQDSEEAAGLMKERQIRRLLVMNRDKRLVGIVSLGDLAKRQIPTGTGFEADEGPVPLIETTLKENVTKQAGETLQAVSEPSQPRPTGTGFEVEEGPVPVEPAFKEKVTK